MWRWLARRRGRTRTPRTPVPADLWQQTLQSFPFLLELCAPEQRRLRELAGLFLEDKEFYGGHGLQITDAMAVAIAAQACLPVLHFGPGACPLSWYDDFVGIVVHPAQVLAHRETMDEIGVVHQYDEVLAGETMHEGPIMLSWQDVTASSSERGYNVVIHEFAHKLDLRDGVANGCPPLPAGFLGLGSFRKAREHWLSTLQAAFEDFREQVSLAERFGAEPPWLDAYGAQSIDEFFAVACESYFVNRPRFAQDFGTLLPLFDGFFRPAS